MWGLSFSLYFVPLMIVSKYNPVLYSFHYPVYNTILNNGKLFCQLLFVALSEFLKSGKLNPLAVNYQFNFIINRCI